MKRFSRLMALVLCCLLLSGCVGDVTSAIDGIGTVTLDSGPAIAAAEDSYNETADLMKMLVDNHPTLVAARTRYNELVEVSGQMTAQLDALGTVDASSGSALAQIRETYDTNTEKYAPEKFNDVRHRLEALEKQFNLCVLEQQLAEAENLYQQKQYSQAIDLVNEILKNEEAAVLEQRCSDLLAKCEKALAEQQRLEAKGLVKKDPLAAIRMLEGIKEAYRYDGDYQKIFDSALKQLKEKRPANAKVLEKTLSGGSNVFVVAVKGGEDFCVKLEMDTDPGKYILVYLRAGKTARIKVPSGSYKIKYASGDYWCNTTDYFYPKTAFMESYYTAKFTSTSTSYTQINYTLYGSAYPNNNLNDTPLSPNEF